MSFQSTDPRKTHVPFIWLLWRKETVAKFSECFLIFLPVVVKYASRVYYLCRVLKLEHIQVRCPTNTNKSQKRCGSHFPDSAVLSKAMSQYYNLINRILQLAAIIIYALVSLQFMINIGAIWVQENYSKWTLSPFKWLINLVRLKDNLIAWLVFSSMLLFGISKCLKITSH